MPESVSGAFPHDAAQRFVESWRPDVRIVRARRLKGGLGAMSHVLTLDGSISSSRLVLRRYLPRESLTPERAEREFRTLMLVRERGIPAPEPLMLDAEGRYFSTPAMLLSYIPGAPLYEPKDVTRWLDDLARTLLSIHSGTEDSADLSWLPRLGRGEVGIEIEELQEAAEADPQGRRVLEALRTFQDRIEWVEPTLIHEDFWPGNTIWSRGRLMAVIDWPSASLGDRRRDVSQCALDVFLEQGLDASDRFRQIYQRLTGEPLPDLWYFDLLIGLRALLYYEIWLIGYRDAGLAITSEVAEGRIRFVLERALNEASAMASKP